jgi:hypothetical protein
MPLYELPDEATAKSQEFDGDNLFSSVNDVTNSSSKWLRNVIFAFLVPVITLIFISIIISLARLGR